MTYLQTCIYVYTCDICKFNIFGGFTFLWTIEIPKGAYDLKTSTTKNWQWDLERDKILWVSNLALELLARNDAVGAKCLRRQR